jgi:hypothetical protein
MKQVDEEYDLSFNDRRFYQQSLLMYDVPKRRDVEVIWICGDSGTGKSRMAEDMGGQDVYDKRADSKWWDGYDGQETIILDDWRPSKYWNVFNTLGVLGGERMRVETKGGHVIAKWTRIIITSIRRPEQYWSENHSDEQVKQLLRRISKIICTDRTGGQASGNTIPTPSCLTSCTCNNITSYNKCAHDIICSKYPI